MLDYLRQFNMASVLLRLTLAVVCGGLIGVNREHKRRPAGFRTYMMVCMGAAFQHVFQIFRGFRPIFYPPVLEIPLSSSCKGKTAPPIEGNLPQLRHHFTTTFSSPSLSFRSCTRAGCISHREPRRFLQSSK